VIPLLFFFQFTLYIQYLNIMPIAEYGHIDTGDYGKGGGSNAGLFHIITFFV
jgi:hypothetical protein